MTEQASLLERFTECVNTIGGYVWGVPLILLIILGGLFLTIRLGGMQFIRLPLAIKYMFKNEKNGTGEVTSFAALCTALSATIGTGNIVGVATAVIAGGPGALFWMWLAALFGMATKYAEGLLAIKFRTHDPKTNHVLGGPFYYIERGMGPKWTWLAKFFALAGVTAGVLGIGTFTQVNSINTAVNTAYVSNSDFANHKDEIAKINDTLINDVQKDISEKYSKYAFPELLEAINSNITKTFEEIRSNLDGSKIIETRPALIYKNNKEIEEIFNTHFVDSNDEKINEARIKITNMVNGKIQDTYKEIFLLSTKNFEIFGETYTSITIISSIVIAFLVGLVVIGGIQRIGKVSEKVIPMMVIIYLALSLLLIVYNIRLIDDAIVLIVKSAFGFDAAAGGMLGAMIVAMQKGVARGIFSNEAGLGSAPIAAAAAQTNEPVRQGLVSMTGTFLDTIIVCSMTGLALVMTGAYTGANGEGAEATMYAFNAGLPFFNKTLTDTIIAICMTLFGFTTILGWDYYSERCLEYLTKGKIGPVIAYRWIYILAVFIGPYMTISVVWGIADIFNGIMAVPNMIALIALSGIVVKETKDFFDRRKRGETIE